LSDRAIIRAYTQRYNASNNELLRTQTLVKSAVVDIDATPFRQWYEAHVSLRIAAAAAAMDFDMSCLASCCHYARPPADAQYAQPAARGGKLAEAAPDAKQSNHVKRVLDERKKTAKLDPILEQQFKAGRLLAILTSRPGQSGRADGYILEGKELDFYHRKLQLKKSKHAA
jgi:small subunit ribosomal protein S8e